MEKQYIFNFKSDISKVDIPQKLNNPFGLFVPEIAKLAAKEFQEFIVVESKNWNYDFHLQKGKMFGVLVVQKEDSSLGYLGTVSGKLPANATCEKFIPSIFDVSTGNYFINKGMTELTVISNQIKNTDNLERISLLKERSRQKSVALQQRLFENYNFLNLSGEEKNVIEIFKGSSHGNPPVAAGECVAPKVLQFAIDHQLKPIALTEFWWGNSIKKNGKKHKLFYPACKDRCRPILEFLLEDSKLFTKSTQFIKD